LGTALVLKSGRRLIPIPILSGIIVLSSCRGFFVNPTLKIITVTPVTPTIAVGSTKQMTAAGTYDDTRQLTGSAPDFKLTKETAFLTLGQRRTSEKRSHI
jgi:hypothetical protein